MLMLKGDSHTQILTTLDVALQRTEERCDVNKLQISNEKNIDIAHVCQKERNV